MAEIKSTSIFKRKKNGKKLPFYYCRFIYDNGTVRTISTKKTTKDTARDYINELIQLESEKNQRLSIEQEKTLIEKQRQELEDEKVRLESLRHLIEKELNIPTVSGETSFR